MPSISCTYEPPSLDDPLFGEDVDIWFTVDRDGEIEFGGVTEANSITAEIPRLHAWGREQLGNIRTYDRAIEAADEDRYWEGGR